MALVCELNVAGKTVVTYNLHLESRGNDDLRSSQLFEVLEDSGRYGSQVPLVVGGDMNFDVAQGDVIERIRQASLQNAFDIGAAVPTAPSSLFRHGRPIDWILTGGPVQERDAQVHQSVRGSDHFPLSLTLLFPQQIAQESRALQPDSERHPTAGR